METKKEVKESEKCYENKYKPKMKEYDLGWGRLGETSKSD